MTKRRRTTKSANGKRTISKYNKSVPYTMYKGIIPATMYVSMRYTELLQLADAVTGLAYNVYNANGIWDPNFSATGHQPMGYDQWSTLYKTYRVKKCTIKAECANNQSTVPCLFIIAPSETTALLANASEQPGAVSCLVSQDTSGPNIRKLGPVTMDMSKFDGDIGAKYMEDMEAQFGANPTNPKCFHVVVQNGVGALSVDCTVYAELDFLVELSEKSTFSR